MDLHVPFDGRRDLAGQIYRRIRAAVLAGELRPGSALPPTREFAHRLGVSRNTVSGVYDRLVAEGLLVARTGAGTYVRSVANGAATTPPPAAVAGSPLRARRAWEQVLLPPDLTETPLFDFRVGSPDPRLFPYATWRRLLGRQVHPSVVGSGLPTDPAGHPALRAAIARHVRVSRGIAASASDVLVTNGIQQSVDLVARVLLAPGARVAVEEPGWSPPRMLFTALGARVVPVPVDDEGIVVDGLPDDARLVYVTPSHQLPLGMAMSHRRRAALLAWAVRHDAAIIEDDYDTEFRYTDQPLSPLHSIDHTGRVLYAGTFSKTLLPALRLGFLVAPPSLHHALLGARFVTDWHSSLFEQAALAEFIDSGGLAAHVRRMRAVYRLRHREIMAALVGPLAPWLEVVGSAAGLHVSAHLRSATATDSSRLVEVARRAGVHIFDFGMFVVDPATRPGLIFGYGAIPTYRVAEGLRRLHDCVKAVLPAPTSS